MDQSGAPQLEHTGVTIKKRRSQTTRRPRTEAQSLPDQSPKSSTPVSDDISKASSDENLVDDNSGGKMFNLNQCVSRSLPVGGSDSRSEVLLGNGRIEKAGSENKLKKVKLKVGGVTHLIQSKSSIVGASGSSSLESSNEYHSPPLDKRSVLQGIPWKDFPKGSLNIGKDDTWGAVTKNAPEKQSDQSNSIRKSKRVPKRRVLHGEFDEDADDNDDEICYLEKLNTSKTTGYKDLEEPLTRKQQKGVKKGNMEDDGKHGRHFRKSRWGDMDYEVEEELLSDGEHEGKRTKKTKKDLPELPTENKREMVLTTRQRALLNKDVPSTSGASQIEFPNGLPPAPPRKHKEKLSEVEQQLKKAEAAERRRLQNEKAARESEAEAIRKILGQDSSRKKREEKMKRRQEELAQEKAVTAQMLLSNTIRTVMGPTGTTVTFPQELGFPEIFDSKPFSYPPPRERCAGPFCTNAYKYRDSKSKLPLCSLQCYKAINEKLETRKVC